MSSGLTFLPQSYTAPRNVVVSLPNTAPVVPVTVHHPHPCGGYYIIDALVYGPSGVIGRWMD